jgi:hypothetical protein
MFIRNRRRTVGCIVYSQRQEEESDELGDEILHANKAMILQSKVNLLNPMQEPPDFFRRRRRAVNACYALL